MPYRPTASHFTILVAILALTACGGSGGGGSDDDSTTGKADWTYMVYLAAENDLAIAGLVDLVNEMVPVGSTSEVNIVVLGEFSQEHTTQAGLRSASEVGVSGLSSFDTRYYRVKKGSLTQRSDYPGSGNLNMASPSTLQTFVTFSKQQYPADHYALVLWNHGDNLAGICQDMGSGGDMLTLPELRTAMAGIASATGSGVDIINCDACLMARFEVALAVDGYCDYLVASAATEPANGDPYDTILKSLIDNPSQSPATLASNTCSLFVASYASDTRSSVTKSAYDMSKLAAFTTAMENLGSTLSTAISGGERSKIAAAHGAAKSLYQGGADIDLGSFLDNLASQFASDASVLTAVQAADSALDTLVIKNSYRSGSVSEAIDVNGICGLGLYLTEAFPTSGFWSQSSYQQAVGARSPNWFQFVVDYASGTATDVEAARFGWMVVWNDAAVDIDLEVWEPDGSWAIPWLGTVSGNGYLSGDSLVTGEPFEIYVAKPFVDVGRYDVFIELWDLAGNSSYPATVYQIDSAAGIDSWTAIGSFTMSFDNLITQPWRSNATLRIEVMSASDPYTDVEFVDQLTITSN